MRLKKIHGALTSCRYGDNDREVRKNRSEGTDDRKSNTGTTQRCRQHASRVGRQDISEETIAVLPKT